MKYLFGLLICTVLFISCDDGDLITENFVFDNAALQKCTNADILYKINGSEALVLNTPESSFVNTVGTRIIPITGNTGIVYKKFASVINTNSVCNSPTEIVLEQWQVTGGNLSIVTTAIFDVNGLTILAYNHNITFQDVTFVANGKQLVYDKYLFGNYRTEVLNLNFDFALDTTQKCGGNNLIFKFNGTKALLLDVDPTLFINTPTPAGSPRTRIIDANNKVIYRIYSGALNNNFFCGSIVPNNPILVEEWIANNGILGTSGEIRVETIMLNATQYQHTIKLYKTTFTKGVQTYIYPTNDSFTFGTYVTP